VPAAHRWSRPATKKLVVPTTSLKGPSGLPSDLPVYLYAHGHIKFRSSQNISGHRTRRDLLMRMISPFKVASAESPLPNSKSTVLLKLFCHGIGHEHCPPGARAFY